MSSSNYAMGADVVSDEFVKKHCLDEFTALQEFLENNGSGLDDYHLERSHQDYPVFDIMSEEEEEELYSQLKELIHALEAKFIKETGLSLYSVFHTREDRGDELDGGMFAVDGVYVYSEAGEKFKDEISTISWTEFG